ncbi:hypothetical protein VaNZ11_003375 [Volvox africanus]|uniref:Guanylate cyclase domain-containing protein n=1 Tax=Volvox africanus TaxID=51714 RepID=A0ABQ5RU07_9CHLO|nr:hypothetical protein VaNZ11_003375 [Volvox africanus]
MGGVASCLGAGQPCRGAGKSAEGASLNRKIDERLAQDVSREKARQAYQTSTDDAFRTTTPRKLSNSTAAGLAARQCAAPLDNPVERLCKETGSGLAVLDRGTLETELRRFPQPVAVLHVAYVTPTPCASNVDTLNSSIGTPVGKAPGPDAALLIQRSSVDGTVSLVFSTEQGSTAVGCILANSAAVNALQLRDEQDMLNFLARSFAKDPSLKVLFQDIIKRLLQGQLRTVNHFVPGDFGSNRYFLSMRIWPFAYHARRLQSPQDCGSVRIQSDRLRHPADGSGAGIAGLADHDSDLVGITPAMILELDVPYEGKELIARLQRDYMIISNIPSIVTMFDMDGRVLHQNRSSIAYMGYLVGMGRNGTSTPQAAAMLSDPDETSIAGCIGGDGGGGNSGAAAAALPPLQGHTARPATAIATHNRLQQLFSHAPNKLREILMAVAEGTEWRGLVRMPARMQWGSQDYDADGEGGDLHGPTRPNNLNPSDRSTESVSTAAHAASTTTARTAKSAVPNITTTSLELTEPSTHRSVDVTPSPSSLSPQSFQRRFTAQLMRELQTTVRSASEARARSSAVSSAPEGSQDVSCTGPNGAAESKRSKSNQSQPRPRLNSVAGVGWAERDACRGNQRRGQLQRTPPSQIQPQQQQQEKRLAETRGLCPLRGWEEQQPASDRAVPITLAMAESSPPPASSDRLAFGALEVAAPPMPGAAYCDLDPVGSSSSSEASATFGDTILAAALSCGATAAAIANPGTKGAPAIQAGSSADAKSDYSGASVDGGTIKETDGACCECSIPAMSPPCTTGMGPKRSEALPAQGEDYRYGGGSEQSPDGCSRPVSSSKSVRSVPIEMMQEASGTHVPEVVLPVLSAPLASSLASSSSCVCPTSYSQLQRPQPDTAATDMLDPDCDPRVENRSSDVGGCNPWSIISCDEHPGSSVETEVTATVDHSEGCVDPTATNREGEAGASAILPQAPEPSQLRAVAGASTPDVDVAFRAPFGIAEVGAGAAASSNVGPDIEDVKADVTLAATQQRVFTDLRLLTATTGSGASGDVLGLWSSSVANALNTGSEPGVAGAATTFDTSISSSPSAASQIVTGAPPRLPTPAAVAAATAAGMSAGQGTSVRPCSPLSRSAARNLVVASDAAGSASPSKKGPLDGFSETEGTVDSVVPGQEDWSSHEGREGVGSVVLEESSCLINTDINFSIELAAHNLRGGSVLQGRRSIGVSLSRANTAGQNASVAPPRALAYIDEEDTRDNVEELSFLLPKVMPYPTPHVAPRLTDPNVDTSLAPAIERSALPASMPVPTAKRSLPQSRASLANNTALVSEEAMHILGSAPVTASPPSTGHAAENGCKGGPSTSSLSAFPGLQLNRAGAVLAKNVHSNPPFTSRTVRRDVLAAGGPPASSTAAAAAAASATTSPHSLPASRVTTTYLQHIGQDEGKGMRAVLKALISVATTDANAASSGSNVMAIGGHASTGSCALTRACSTLPGAATRGKDLTSAQLSKLPCNGCGDMFLDGGVAIEAAAAPESVTATAGMAGTSRGPLSPAGADATRWHEVHVRPCFDPMSSEPLTMVIQTDVTSKVRAEELLARVLEAEHRLLADIFPSHVVHYMTQRRKDTAELERNGLTLLRHIQDPAAVATLHDNVTVLFADIKGFTEMSKEVPPAVVMTFLNDLYTRFDSLTDVYGVYKVETIGDCYMVAGGLVARDGDGYGRTVRGQGNTDPLHAMRVVAFARAMLEEAAKVALPSTGEPVQVRVGIHSGSVMSGVVGQKMPRFCLFGDTINTASRMESTGRPGAIHVSCATRILLPPEEDEELWASTGGVEVKGKGRMDTYLWSPQSPAASRQRRDKQQRAMLLGTLSTLQPPSPSVSPPSSKRLVVGRVGAGCGCNASVSAAGGAPSNQILHQKLSGSGASLSRLTGHLFDPTSTLC